MKVDLNTGDLPKDALFVAVTLTQYNTNLRENNIVNVLAAVNKYHQLMALLYSCSN